MPDKLTDADVKKALECCSSGSYGCENGCPLDKECDSPIRGSEKIMKYALDLINRQEEEIERLNNLCQEQNAEVKRVIETKDRLLYNLKAVCEEKDEENIKAEAYKEFAERLCEDRVSNDPVVIAAKCLLKEMEGELNGTQPEASD